MEPEELFVLEKGPESLSLTMLPIKESEHTAPETVVFKKQREEFHVLYISDNLWPFDRELLEATENSGGLQTVLTALQIESLKNLPLCYVLQNQDGGSCGWQ